MNGAMAKLQIQCNNKLVGVCIGKGLIALRTWYLQTAFANTLLAVHINLHGTTLTTRVKWPNSQTTS